MSNKKKKNASEEISEEVKEKSENETAPEEKTESAEKENSSEENSDKAAEDEADKSENIEKSKKKPADEAAKSGIKKRFKYGTLSVALTVIFVTAVVLLNVIFNMLLDRFDISADLTDNSIYSIDESTVKYLSGLEDEISIIVAQDETAFENSTLSDGTMYGKQVSEIIKRFTAANSSIKAEYKGLENNPGFYSQYGSDLSSGSIIVESKNTGRNVVLTGNDYLSPKYYFQGEEVGYQLFSQYYMYYGGYADLFSIEYSAAAEKCLLSAIMNVSNTDPVAVAVISEDYGAAAPAALVNLLEANAYTVDEIKLTTLETIPQDYDIVIFSGPLYDPANEDLDKIDSWLDNNGKLGKTFFYIPSASTDTLPNLYTYLEEWGISVGSGYVYQTNANYANEANPIYQLLDIQDTDYSEGVDMDTKACQAIGLKPLTLMFEEKSNYVTVNIISTYDGAVVCPYDELQSFDPSTAEKSGVITVAAESNKVIYEGLDETLSRVYVFANDIFFDSTYLESTYLNNADIVINTFIKASGKDKVEVTVTPRSYSIPTFEITAAQVNGIAIVFIIVLPVLIAAAGIIVIVRRKRR